jgi:hypothetical protein
VPFPPVGAEPVMTSGFPVPQKLVVAGAVNVFPPSTGVIVTACEDASVEEHETPLILDAFTVRVVDVDKTADVNVNAPPVPNFDDPDEVAPLKS